MLLAVFLALCHSVVAAQPHIDHTAVDDAPSAMSITSSAFNPVLTHSGTVYVMANHPTLLSSDIELALEKRDSFVSSGNDYVEATVVVATVPPALSTILTPQDPSTKITVLKDDTTAPAPGPSGAYGSGGGTSPGTGPGTGPGSGTGTGPGAGTGSGPGSDSGNNPSSGGPGSGAGSGPGSNGPGSNSPGGNNPGSNGPGGNNPDNGSGSDTGNGGQPNLPSGAYGQPPNTAGQQPSSPAGEQSPYPSGQQSPNPTAQQSPYPSGQQSPYPSGQQSPNPQGQQPSNTEGQQSTNPTAGQSQNPSGGQTPNPTGEQSPNPAGQQSPSPTITGPGVLITTVPLLGTIVETVTISLESAPGNGPFPNSPTTELLPTTFVTIQASSPPSIPCESDTVPWGLLSAPDTPAPTTFATIPGAGGPVPVPTTTGTPNTITLTVPGNQGQPSAPAPIFATPGTPGTIIVTVPGSQVQTSASGTTPAATGTPGTIIVTVPGSQGQSSAPGTIPAATGTPGPVTVTVPGSHGQSSASVPSPKPMTPNAPGWATTPNVPSWATVSGTTVTVPSSLHSSPGTAGPQLYSSTCTTGLYTDVISTAAATLAVGSSAPSQHTTWSFETFATATPTVTPIPITNAGGVTIGLSLSVICSVIALVFITSITTMI
ncbi:hypothetical protein F5B18DRAFT_669887 [Nemania serpens]|nr:hypothetical protein F5B18DRAFT_669887 [Nemania serpens]